ncbi:MAG: aldehyde dehydrogenase family protein [Flavobacteriaceae bacterium]
MDYSSSRYFSLFTKQKENQYKVANTSYKERIKKLILIKEALEVTYKDQIRKALYNDFKKPFAETDLTEIYQIIGEIKHAKKHLKSWMSNQKVKTPLALLGTSSSYKYEPKGVCLIISPWNYPINLTFDPLVSAIAAGNTAIIKPSELTPNTSRVMAKIINDLFDENEVALIEGDAETSQELLKLPFNHIFFTGSPKVGKIVMQAAAKNLSSVTLELGGKSPTIIDETANIKSAVKKTVWGKFLNNGQTCIAPDYILINDTIKNDFVNEFKTNLEYFFTKDIMASNSICRIVNRNHFNRLIKHLEDAKSKNASIEIGGQSQPEENFISPTLISNLSENASLLQDEIFGPILPIITYKSIEEAVTYINSKEKPLSLYIYSKNKNNVDYIINNTRAGSTCINNNLLQASNHYLPFGGTNNSGMGKSHGFFGFQEFSNTRSVLKYNFKGFTENFYPPYTSAKQKLIDLAIKWF